LMRRSDMHQNLTRPQRTPHRALRIHAVTVAAALVVVLAGCTSGGPAPSADPSGPTGPVSLVGVGCDELVSLDDVRSILNDNVEPVDNFFYPGGSWPLATVGLHQSGALV